MFLVQPLQRLTLARDFRQDVRDLVADIRPPRWQQVHLDHGVAVVRVVGALGEEAAPVVVCGEEHACVGAGARTATGAA